MEEFIAQQLYLMQQDRNKLKEKIDKLDDKVQKSITKIGIKPRESEDQLVVTLRRLEFNHTTTSQSNSDERKFMQERDKILVKQKQVVEYNEAQLELDKLKIALNASRIEMREKDKLIDDLKANQRRVIIANKLKCSMDDIIEQKLTIPAEKIPQIIGKKGANLKKIEDETSASIKPERSGGGLAIVGTPESIKNAIAIIMSVVNSAIEDISPSEEAITCLLFNKAALVDEIQSKCNVRIDISKAQKLCKISGTLDCIAAAKREISNIDCLKNEITITPTMLPFILGKGGSTIRGLGEGKIVQIDISKENNFIVILGLRKHVELVTATLHDIISENKEVEEILQTPKHILLGACSGSNNTRNLAKEYGVSILLDDKKECITIRGVTSKVLQAKFYLTSLLSNYQKHSVSINVNEQYLAWIVGKGGKNINDLRKKYPGANIDIIDTSIHVNTSSAETRKEIIAYINGVVDSKYSKEIPFDSNLSITLKSQKGAAIRKTIVDDLKLVIDIDTSNQVVKLRGIKANVDLAIVELEAFRKKYHCEVLSINDGDFWVLQEKGSDSLVQKMELDFSVEINVSRKDGIVRVRGEKAAVDKAKSAIIGILEGDSNHGSALMYVLPTALSALIGKNGQTMKKMEKDHNVKIDVLQSENKIRLRGPPENISKASEAISKFIDDVKVTLTVTIESFTKNFDAKALADEVSSLYDTEAIVKDNEITIKGTAYIAEEAKKYVQNKTANSLEYTIDLKSHQLSALRAITCERSFRGIADRNNISISIDEKSLSLNVKGAGPNVHNAKIEVIKLVLCSTFPTEFLIMEFELSTLKDIASPKMVMEIEEATGAKLMVERSHACLFVMGDTNSVITAAQMIKDKKKIWEKLHAFFDIQEFMLSSIVGKQGTNIIALQKETETTINVNKKSMQLEVIASSADNMAKAKTLIQNKIDKLKKEHWEIELPIALLKLFIGKQGSNINKVRTETGASVEIVDKSCVVKVTGNESSVSAARETILKFLDIETEKNFQIDLPIPPDAIGLIVGSKGTKIKEIHDVSDAKIDIDKLKNILIIKGTQASCKKAEELVNQILDEAGYNKEPEPIIEVEDELDNEVTNTNEEIVISGKFGRLPPGATPEMIAKMQEQSLSKSALRRKRRKEKEWKETVKNVDDNASQFDYDEVYSIPKDDMIFKNETFTAPIASLEVLKEDLSKNTLTMFPSHSFIKPGAILTNFNFDNNIIDNNTKSANTSPKNDVGIIGSPRVSASSTTINISGGSSSSSSTTFGNIGISSLLELRSNGNNSSSFAAPPGLPQPSFPSNYNPTLSVPFNNSYSNDTKPASEANTDGYFKSKSGFSIRI